MPKNSGLALLFIIILGIGYLVVTVASKITQELAEKIVLILLAILIIFCLGMLAGAQTYFVLLKRREARERELRKEYGGKNRETQAQAQPYYVPQYLPPPSYFYSGQPRQETVDAAPIVNRENKPPEWTIIGNPAVRTGRDL